MARAADQRIKAGDAAPMTGIPVGVKDVFCVKGVPSQAGSPAPAGVHPGIRIDRDAEPVERGRVMLASRPGRIRDGFDQRIQLLWSCGEPVAPDLTARS